MDDYSNRRSLGGVSISRKGPSLVQRDSNENNRDRNVQVCSRVGCSSRVNSMKDAQINSPKAKTPKTPFQSPAQRKGSFGNSSSKNLATPSSSRKSFMDPKKKLDSEGEAEKVTGKSLIEDQDYHVEASSSEAGSSSSGPTSRFMKRNTQRIGFGRHDPGPSSSGSLGFKQVNQVPSNGGASTSRYNLRNLKCNSNSISDVVSSGSPVCPESSALTRKRDMGGRKRISEAESSLSVRGKKMSGTMQDDKRNNNDYTNRGILISEARRGRSSSPGNSDVTSVRTRRVSCRTRLSNQESQDRLPLIESPLANPSSPQLDLSSDETEFSLENQFAGHTPASNLLSSFSRPGSGSERVRSSRAIGPYDVGIARSFMNRDNLRQYNLDGIAEMLLALERIEQEDEPTYEQLLVLETNLFLGGLGFHDQHREMRLDIDNMSYEELLALEERMGSVSTAVPEEVLAKCLKKSIYQSIANGRENEIDIKCTICQEEYGDGEEIGRLSCDHKYHIECINQWLRLKNWCPICKASVSPSPSQTPPP